MKITAAEMTSSQKRRFFIGMLMLLMFAGIIAGTLLVIIDTKGKYVSEPVFNQHLLKNGAVKTLFETFAGSFFTLEAILIFQMTCGFFAIGQPMCAFTLFHRGASGGIAAALIYMTYGLKGFFIILVMLLPILIFNMYILVLGARESIKFSNVLLCYAVGKNTERDTDIKFYFIKFLVLTVFAIICSALDSTLTYIFRGLLN